MMHLQNQSSTLSATRVPVEPHPCPGNAGIRQRYPIDTVPWIWLPEGVGDSGIQVVRFQLAFELAAAATLCFDVSADQRYQLRLDGAVFGRGPDRAEAGGWSFHRYEVPLAAGPHCLEALCWWLAPQFAPQAQVSVRPGFVCAGVDEASKILNTGSAGWQVQALQGISALPKCRKLSYHVIGCGFRLEAGRQEGPWLTPKPVFQGHDDRTGVMHAPWRCEPSPLPEQEAQLFAGGRIRGVAAAESYQPLCQGFPVQIPAHSRVTLFWDFETYVCGYGRVHLRGGAGSVLGVEWAESLYESPEPEARMPKGKRSEIDGKHWLGFGDEVQHPGGEREEEFLWWRSGRWLRIEVQTAAEPLEILDLRPRRTGYPFTPRWQFLSSGISPELLQICEAGLRNCVHENFVDCPYYEQLQYLGDTRIQALSWLVTSGDPRPVARALELFDRSRWVNGFCAERCPSRELQMSATYSLFFPMLLRDFHYWCDEAARVRRHLPGMRASLEMALASLGDSGLPEHLPGWLFVDWVKAPFWRGGVPGGESRSISSVIALQLPLGLLAAAEVEDSLGDPLLAQRWREQARQVYGRIETHFWCGTRGLLADDVEKTLWSEHAQALALLLPFPDAEKRASMLDALLHPAADLAKATVYFSFYVHEVLMQSGCSAAVLERFAFWDQLHAQGFVTTVEAPEPARSDCHGWGSHPLYHSLSGFAGIRPAAPGFAQVSVTPCPGPLQDFEAVLPHPLGEIRARFAKADAQVSFEILTPVPGNLHWQGTSRPLTPGGENRFCF